ncbi:hypothetical protein TSYNTROPHJE_00400 [Tepidanaerobacter syntrophicus]|nr:hypothetical protein TSYNTROPHJE_00400 [Tepidanaerobacter syntrophicus]
MRNNICFITLEITLDPLLMLRMTGERHEIAQNDGKDGLLEKVLHYYNECAIIIVSKT